MIKVDFSILNDTDIFYVDCGWGGKWLAKGDFLELDKSKHMNIETKALYTTNRLTTRSGVEELRIATPKEIEIFYVYFPGEKKWETTKIITHLTIKDMQEAGWKFKYTK